MKNRTRLVIAGALSAVAGIAVALSGASTFSLWSDQTTTTPQTLTAAAQTLTVNRQNTTAYPVSTDTLTAITPATPKNVLLQMRGTANGNAGLAYAMAAPTLSGSTGLTGALHATVTLIDSDADCATGGVPRGTVLYDGNLTSLSTTPRTIAKPLRANTTFGESLCLRLSLPSGYGDYVNHATVTMDSDSGPVSSTTEWHGTATAPASAPVPALTLNFQTTTVRPGA